MYARGMLSIFRNLEVFDETTLPDAFLHRNREMEELKSCVSPLNEGLLGFNAVIHGPPATGKTTAMRLLLEQLGGKIAGVYVNIARNSTPWAVLCEMHSRLTGQLSRPSRSGGTNHLVREVFRHLKKEGKHLALCLDEFQAMSKSDLDWLLQTFLRPWEFCREGKDIKTALILASSSGNLQGLRNAVVSSLCPRWIHFKPYTAEQMYDILEARAIAGFGRGVVSSKALWLLATAARDLRHGILLLRTAGEVAEKQGLTKIGVREVEQAFAMLPSSTSELRLSDAERRILQEIKARGEMRSGEIYEFSRRELGLGRSRTHEILNNLLSIGAVEAKTINRRGMTRIFRVSRGWRSC